MESDPQRGGGEAENNNDPEKPLTTRPFCAPQSAEGCPEKEEHFRGEKPQVHPAIFQAPHLLLPLQGLHLVSFFGSYLQSYTVNPAMFLLRATTNLSNFFCVFSLRVSLTYVSALKIYL